MNLADKVKQAGVVGAGGGGFPAHIKLASRAGTVIANGAECEPLLHKDAVIMETRAADLIRGVQLAMDAVGAKDGIIGIKAKKKKAVEAVAKALQGTNVRMHLLGDYYPAGDEYDLVFNVTGKLIPPGGIPIAVGVVVNNVETLVNIADAADGRPVTHKLLTVSGAVKRPATIRVPLGTSWRDCIAAAGGPGTYDPVLCVGGLMMGQVTDDLDTPVTKTSTGVIVLPRSHRVIERKLKPNAIQTRIGKSACDQCRYCTEFCPRFLLGYAVEPHQVMRTLAFTATGQEVFNQWAALCCACGLCTLYSCPEELFPKEACDDAKATIRRTGVKWTGPMNPRPHPLHDGRRTPIQALTRKLDVEAYDLPAPFSPVEIQPGRLVLLLRQGAGSPANPLVKAGDTVSAGQIIADAPDKSPGAPVHAPMEATVESVTEKQIVLLR